MKSKTINRKSRIASGFTLIELLVVIVIIVALLAMLFPALAAARHRARVTRAKLEMKQLETAWISYRNDYRHLPTLNVYQGRMNQNAVDILRGQPTQVGTETYNSRSIAYMEFPYQMTQFVDPWWREGMPTPRGVYKLRLAPAANPNQVNLPLPFSGSLPRPVALWSDGYDLANPITSW